jgi:WD40 repeat protein
LEKAMMLLSADRSERENNNFKQVKRELLTHNELSKLAKIVSKKDHKYYGRVMCISMFGNYLFVGTSIGVIRVFDTVRQTESQPLVNNALRRRVSCIYVEPEGNFLLSGHCKGSAILWDLKQYKMVYHLENAHNKDATI